MTAHPHDEVPFDPGVVAGSVAGLLGHAGWPLML